MESANSRHLKFSILAQRFGLVPSGQLRGSHCESLLALSSRRFPVISLSPKIVKIQTLQHLSLQALFSCVSVQGSKKPWSRFMSVPNEENLSSHSQLSSHFFLDLLDSIIVDVASECHRVARLGLDSNLEEEDEELKLSAQARVRVADPSNSNETNGKYVVDIFGQTHPPVANEIFDCMNCGRSIMAGRFAPHLEKCMGKGRKARLKVTRSSTAAAQNRYSRGSPGSTYSPYSPYSNYSTNNSMNRLANGTSTFAGEEHTNGTLDS